MAGWTGRGARILRAAADLLQKEEGRLPTSSPVTSRILEDDDLLAVAGDHGLSLLDEDCHGYLIVRLVELDGKLHLVNEYVMPGIAWPAVREYLEQMGDNLGRELA